MGMRNVFINELGISNHLVLLIRFNCEECGRLISRLEHYWEIDHYETPSAFDEGHVHILCTTCAPRIENAEAIYITYYAKFLECDCHGIHIRKIEKMVRSSVKGIHRPTAVIATTIPPVVKLQEGIGIQSDKTCPDCGKPMIFKNSGYHCSNCDYHTDASCAQLDEFCKCFDIEAFACSGKKSITIPLK